MFSSLFDLARRYRKVIASAVSGAVVWAGLKIGLDVDADVAALVGTIVSALVVAVTSNDRLDRIGAILGRYRKAIASAVGYGVSWLALRVGFDVDPEVAFGIGLAVAGFLVALFPNDPPLEEADLGLIGRDTVDEPRRRRGRKK